MKKLLLLSIIITTMNLKAQDFWTQFPTGQPTVSTGVRSISMVDVNTTWLSMRVGVFGINDFMRYTKTVDGGNTWTTAAIDLGVDSQNLLISNIHGVSDQVAFAAAHPTIINTFGGIWKTIDGGTTWAKQASAAFSDPMSFPNLVYFWNANEGVTVGDPTNGYFEIYTTTNGGDTWTRIASTPALIPIDPFDYGVLNNFTTNGNTIWVGTTFGRILKSLDKGMTWTAIQSPIPDFGGDVNGNEFAAMAFSDQNNGIIQTSEWQLFKTNDGGVTWTDVMWNGTFRSYGIAAVPGLTDTYVCVGEDMSLVQRGSSFSVDGGFNWTDINDNPDLVYVDGLQIAMHDEDHGYAGGWTASPTEGGIFRWGGGPMLRAAHLLAVSTFEGDQSVTVSPNPTSGILNIERKNIRQVIVYDILGKQISETNYSAVDAATINLDDLTSGVYMVKISNDQGNSIVKVVKQ